MTCLGWRGRVTVKGATMAVKHKRKDVEDALLYWGRRAARAEEALSAAEAECAAARLLQPQRMTMGQADRWDRFVISQKDNDATRARLGLGMIGEAR